MSNLVERVEPALKNPGKSPWLPRITTELVETCWLNLYRKTGISPDTYGTVRVIARDAGAPRNLIGEVPTFTGAGSSGKALQVETFDAHLASHYEEDGLRFYTADEIHAANILEQLRNAIEVLKPVPTLFKTVTSLVRSIHVLNPGNDDFDVSFSEPAIPFSIFVSVPKTRSATNTLRIAESIVHEAMHLQLTLIEGHVPLVMNTRKKIFSPWRGEFRTVRGVLHALYVFRVIDKLLESFLNTENSSTDKLEHIQMRRDEIHLQINKIRSFQNCSDLTRTGSIFVKKLIQN